MSIHVTSVASRANYCGLWTIQRWVDNFVWWNTLHTGIIILEYHTILPSYMSFSRNSLNWTPELYICTCKDANEEHACFIIYCISYILYHNYAGCILFLPNSFTLYTMLTTSFSTSYCEFEGHGNARVLVYAICSGMYSFKLCISGSLKIRILGVFTSKVSVTFEGIIVIKGEKGSVSYHNSTNLQKA